jgi:hypothetical protein
MLLEDGKRHNPPAKAKITTPTRIEIIVFLLIAKQQDPATKLIDPNHKNR